MLSLVNAIAATQVITFCLALVLGVITIIIRQQENEFGLNHYKEAVNGALSSRSAELGFFLQDLGKISRMGTSHYQRFRSASPVVSSSFSTLEASDYPNQWFETHLPYAENVDFDGGFKVEASVYFSFDTTSYWAVERTNLSTTGVPVLARKRKAASLSTASVYSVNRNSAGLLSLGAQISTVSTANFPFGCVGNSSCNGTVTSVAVWDDTSFVPAIQIRSGTSMTSSHFVEAVTASSQQTQQRIDDSKEHVLESQSVVESTFFLVDPEGMLVVSTSPAERERREACVAQAVSSTAKRACVSVKAVDHPDWTLSTAAKMFSGRSYTAGVQLHASNEDTQYAASPISYEGQNWVLIHAGKPFVRSNATVLTLTIVFALIEFFFALIMRVRSAQEFRKPMNRLIAAMTQVMQLDFSGFDDAVEELESTRIQEVRDISVVFFEMAGAVQGFGQYVPKEVIRELQETDSLHSRVMTSKVLTFMFVDIANFTTMCESLNTDDLAELAERYFSVATRTCVIHGCTIDKFIGDAIMGFWGAPLDYTTQGYSSCCTALHLLTVVDRLQPAYESMGVQLAIRIGLHRGESLVGNIGCEYRICYTALGTSATIGSKLEGMNKHFSTSIIVSQAVIDDAEKTRENLFVTRRLGTAALEDGGSLPVFELVGVNKGELKKTEPQTTAAAKERRRRRQLAHKGMILDTGSASERSSGIDGGTTYSGAVPQTATCSSHQGVGGEKLAQLTEEEEVAVVRQSLQLDESVITAMGLLSESVLLYEQMNFQEAASVLQSVINDYEKSLTVIGIKMAALDKTLKLYEKLAKTRPSEKQFAKGWVKL